MERHQSGASSVPNGAVDTVETVTQAARRALALLERNGRLTADDVVEAARDPKSPLHHYFTWDDAQAAHARRIDEARSLIRSVRVVVTYESSKIAVPRYVRDTARDDDVQGYVTAEQIRREPQNAKSLLRYEFSRASAHVARAVEIAKSIGLEPETRRIAKSIERLLGKLG